MLFHILMVALSSSIDSFGIGISYGVRKIKLPIYTLIIISLISFLFSSSSIMFGNLLLKILPVKAAKLTGILILIFMGIWIIIQANKEKENKKEKMTVCSFLIKSLGITIQIIRTPESCDINKSNKIEAFEAFYLGVALSIDSIGAGIGSSVLGVQTILLPLNIVIFQLLFLLIGTFTGKHMNHKNTKNNKWVILSGSLLIIVAIIRLILS